MAKAADTPTMDLHRADAHGLTREQFCCVSPNHLATHRQWCLAVQAGRHLFTSNTRQAPRIHHQAPGKLPGSLTSCGAAQQESRPSTSPPHLQAAGWRLGGRQQRPAVRGARPRPRRQALRLRRLRRQIVDCPECPGRLHFVVRSQTLSFTSMAAAPLPPGHHASVAHNPAILDLSVT